MLRRLFFAPAATTDWSIGIADEESGAGVGVAVSAPERTGGAADSQAPGGNSTGPGAGSSAGAGSRSGACGAGAGGASTRVGFAACGGSSVVREGATAVDRPLRAPVFFAFGSDAAGGTGT